MLRCAVSHDHKRSPASIPLPPPQKYVGAHREACDERRADSLLEQVRASEARVRANPRGALLAGRAHGAGRRQRCVRQGGGGSSTAHPSPRAHHLLPCCLRPSRASRPAVSSELSREMVALRQRLYKLKNEEKAGIAGACAALTGLGLGVGCRRRDPRTLEPPPAHTLSAPPPRPHLLRLCLQTRSGRT